MKKRIEDKINEIEKYLQEFETMLPQSIEEYEEDLKEKAACERYFEKIIEAATDLAFLMMKYRKLPAPEDDKAVFDILKKAKLISQETCEKMQEAKGMRNLLVHQYGEINDEIVFNAVTEELGNDVRSFMKEIKKDLNTKPKDE